MTETDLELWRLKAKIEAIRVLLRVLYTGMANSSPTGAESLRDRFAALRQDHGRITFPGLPPEYSDALSAEYQEALDDLLTSIESGFR